MARVYVPITIPGVLDLIRLNIEGAEHVREYSEECKAISQRLGRLKDKLNGSEERLRHELGDRTFEKTIRGLFRDLTKIRHAISQCQSSSEALKGAQKLIAAQALKRELDTVHISLINYEADLTADLESKKEILSVALREKQIRDKNRQNAQIEERARLFLNMIETETELLARKSLPKLYEKYQKIINSYLKRCTKVHTHIPIVGLEATMKDFVTEIYKVPDSTFSDKIINKHRNIELPVESVYIHLKADHSTTFEREQARKLILKDSDEDNREKDAYDREMWMELASAPIMGALIERERVQKEKESDKTKFREILRNNRWIVILGDPGSGKTTFVRWLVSKYIQNLGKDYGKEDDDASDEDRGNESLSDEEENNGKSTTKNSKDDGFAVGSPRIPILIRVGEFVEALNRNSELSLIKYIGFHTWMGNPMLNFESNTNNNEQEKEMQELQTALHAYISQGYALIILDGLDEIPETTTRSRVVRLVEEFVANHVQTPSSVSIFDNQFADRELDIPYKAGGNQLIITSRIAGYHAHPLNGQFSHYTILPMEIDDTKNFAEHWFQTVHKELISLLELGISDETRKKVCSQQVALLKEELDNTTNKGLRQMASNPCLMNFICLIAFRTPNAKLPDCRIRLYDDIAMLMMNLWISRNPSGPAGQRNTIDRILCDIATYIHQNCSSGLIERTNLRMVCSKSLQTRIESRDKNKQEALVNECVTEFENNAGILAARGQHLYGFLHLTLQEYYTCKWIVSIEQDKDRPKKLVKVFQDHITDPRFRVPLILALGWISWIWELEEFNGFCQELFTSKNDLSRYFPLEILMFITAIDEFEKLPSKDNIFIGLSRLLSVAAENNWHLNYSNLEKKMARGLLKLPNAYITEWIKEVFSSKETTISSISALCTLLKECERIAESSENEEKKVLLKQWTTKDVIAKLFNCLHYDNVGNQFLVDAVLSKIAIKNPRVLPSSDLRRVFNENSDYITQLSLPILSAIIALCGGLKFSYDEKKKNRDKPFVYDGPMVASPDFAIVFSHEHMHRESPLASLLTEYIRSHHSKSQTTFESNFIERILVDAAKLKRDDRSSKAVDIFVLIFCVVGIDKIWIYLPFIKYEAFHLAIDRFKRISNYLRQFYFIPEIYNRFEKSISSKESLLSNFDNFSEYMYLRTMINRDSTHLIDLFMNWQHINDKMQRKVSANSLELFFGFIDSVCRGRARLCTSTRTSFTNKWHCKSDQRLLLLPKFFRKQENLKNLLVSSRNGSSESDIAIPLFLRTLWVFNDSHHGADMSEVTIKKAEFSMLLEYDKNHSYALAFVPKHLQLLYSRAIHRGHIVVQKDYKNTTVIRNSDNILSFSHILCTSLLSICCSSVSYACQSAFVALLPLARFYRLEHMVLGLLYWSQIKSEYDPGAVKWYFEEMKRPRAATQLSYTDKYDKLTEVERVEISDAEVDQGLQTAVEQAVRRLKDALKFLKSNESSENSNIEVFAASVALGYLCWSSKSKDEMKLFSEAIKAALEISNPTIRLDALIILASCPFFCSSDYFLLERHEMQLNLYKSTKEAFENLSSNLTPLLSVSFVDRYITLLGADDKVVERIGNIMKETKLLHDEDDRRAVCIGLSACANLDPEISSKFFGLMQKFTQSSVLTCTQILQFDSPLLRYFGDDSKEHKTMSGSFLQDRDHSQSISVLYASMYLANLSSDLQKLSHWLNSSSLLAVDISRLSNKNLNQSQTQRILTYSHIEAINSRLNSIDDVTEINHEIDVLDIELHNFYRCEWNAQPYLKQWLQKRGKPPHTTLAFHAALILGRSNEWTTEIADILCDLLVDKNDRLRQETEALLNGKSRTTSETGMNVLLVFIERFIVYQTKSAYASFILGQFFDRLTVDNTDHLDRIIELEKQRTNFHKKYKTETEDESMSGERERLFQNASPIARWFVHLTPDVLQYFLKYLQSFINDLPARRNRDRLKLTESHRLFVFSWCAKILSIDENAVDMMLSILSKVLKGNYASNTQSSAAFILGHSSKQEVQQILLEVIENKASSDTNIPETVVAACLHAYCWSCALNKIKNSDDKQDNDDEGHKKDDKVDENEKVVKLCEKLLKHQSSDVQEAAKIELAKFCPNVEKLLKYFENDPVVCYQSLVSVRIHESDTKSLKEHSKCVVELIKAHSDLLSFYALDLYNSVKTFGDELQPYSEWSEEFGELFLVQIACDLIEEMPAAFFGEIDRMKDSENLQKALLYTSKQHGHRRRNACIKLLSSFGDFNIEICNLFINSLIENPSIQGTCFDALKYFRKPHASDRKEKIIRQVDQVLEYREPRLEQLKVCLEHLKKELHDFEGTAGSQEATLNQVKLILDKLNIDQEQVKSTLELLRKDLEKIEPIVKEWKLALEKLAESLESPSLIKRWGAAVFFERLVQCNVLSAHRVQHLLSKAIEDPSSKGKVWLRKNDDNQGGYSCYGSLNHMLCKLLMRLSSVDETSIEINVDQSKNRLLEDFEAAEINAKLASCINIDDDPIDSDYETDDNEKDDRQKIKNIPPPPRSSRIESARLSREKNTETSRPTARASSAKLPTSKSSICSVM